MRVKCSFSLLLVFILSFPDFLRQSSEVEVVKLNGSPGIRTQEPFIVNPFDPGEVVIVSKVELG